MGAPLIFETRPSFAPICVLTVTFMAGLLAALPPLIAIGLALVTRRVLPSLGLGIIAGALVAGSAAPLQSVQHLLSYARSALFTPSHLSILFFSLLLGGLIGVMGRSGEHKRLAALVTRYATTPMRGQLVTWMFGLVIFFDDYLNSLVIGSSMRPIFDKLRISREKLAFLVDATAAPVASVALVSSWIAVEIGYIDEQYQSLGLSVDAYWVFIQSLPYRFYPFLMLAFVFIIAVSRRDFGPMHLAEESARRKQSAPWPDLELEVDVELAPTSLSPPETDARAWISALPILVLLAVALIGMWLDGYVRTIDDAVDPSFHNIVSRSRSYLVLLVAALSGNVAAAILSTFVRKRPFRKWGRDAVSGARRMLEPCGILILAWTLAAVCRDLQTAKHLVTLLQGGLWAPLFPASVFIFAAATSFATGTSWGTMAILFPLVVPLAHEISGGNEEILLSSISSILGGAVWGDHCSPVSDTTIMSSLASGCDHISHVKTQLPYALVVGAVSLCLGEVATGLGILTPFSALFLGLVTLFVIVRAFGRTPTFPPTPP